MTRTTRSLPAWSALVVAVAVPVWLLSVPAAAQENRPGGGGGAGAANGGGGGGGGGAAAGGGGGGSAPASNGGGASSGGSGGSSGGGGGSSMRSGGDGGSRATGGSGTRSESGGGRFGATGGGGYAVPRGERAAERASGNSGGSGSGSASSGGSTAERSPVSGAGYTDRAVRRGEGTGRVSERSPDGTDTGVPEYARPRNGKDPVGTAVPRGSVPSTGRVGGPLIISGGGYYGGYYDPWWYSPGYVGAYGGYYDPWYGGYPSYPQTTYSSYTDDGALRLKIKPRNAEVYVDGFFVGVVDDFDGIFQRLHLETGAHRIEVRAPGYEPLALDVRITPEHTTTYQGELKKIQ